MSDATTILHMRVPARRLQRAGNILGKLDPTRRAGNLLLARIEITHELPIEISPRLNPLLTVREQAAAWTEAFGAY